MSMKHPQRYHDAADRRRRNTRRLRKQAIRERRARLEAERLAKQGGGQGAAPPATAEGAAARGRGAQS